MRLKRTLGDVVVSEAEFNRVRWLAAQLLLSDGRARDLVDVLEVIHSRTTFECNGKKHHRAGALTRLYSRRRRLWDGA